MTKPIDIKRFASLLSADNELDGVERKLRLMGDRRQARRIANVRDILARVLDDEQACLYEALMDPR
jgi:hypothetical protein